MHDKAFNITKNTIYDRYQRGLASMVYKDFDKKTSGGAVRNKNMSNQNPLDLARVAKISNCNISDCMRELAEELQKPIIRKFEKRKVYSSFIHNIWGADLADTQLISKPNKRIRFFIMCSQYVQ